MEKWELDNNRACVPGSGRCHWGLGYFNFWRRPGESGLFGDTPPDVGASLVMFNRPASP